jgi:hypothetical protein
VEGVRLRDRRPDRERLLGLCAQVVDGPPLEGERPGERVDRLHDARPEVPARLGLSDLVCRAAGRRDDPRRDLLRRLPGVPLE